MKKEQSSSTTGAVRAYQVGVKYTVKVFVGEDLKSINIYADSIEHAKRKGARVAKQKWSLSRSDFALGFAGVEACPTARIVRVRK